MLRAAEARAEGCSKRVQGGAGAFRPRIVSDRPCRFAAESLAGWIFGWCGRQMPYLRIFRRSFARANTQFPQRRRRHCDAPAFPVWPYEDGQKVCHGIGSHALQIVARRLFCRFARPLYAALRRFPGGRIVNFDHVILAQKVAA